MTQTRFLWMCSRVKNAGKMKQGGNGDVVFELKPEIHVCHRYGRTDQITIVFTEDQARYLIPSQHELEQIFKLFEENENVVQLLHDWCDQNLTKT